MFENINKFFKKLFKSESSENNSGKEAKERLHLVLMQDRANVSADFLDMMKQEIIEVIKKYIDVDENAIDVRLTNQNNEDGTNGAPALYANIPIINIKEESKKEEKNEEVKKEVVEENATSNEDDKSEKNDDSETKVIEEKNESEVIEEKDEEKNSEVEEESHNEEKEENNDNESKD